MRQWVVVIFNPTAVPIVTNKNNYVMIYNLKINKKM